MKDAFGASGFHDGRAQYYGEPGFVRITEARVNAAETRGYVRFAWMCEFQKGTKVLVHVYSQTGTEIVGALFVDPHTH